jgi:hypothetical protein
MYVIANFQLIKIAYSVRLTQYSIRIMNDDSKDIKKGSQSDHVSAHKPSPTAQKKGIDASLPFADEAKEEERARDSDSSHGEVQHVVKEHVDHKAGRGSNISYQDSSKVVEHEEPASPPHPGAVAVGGRDHASPNDEVTRDEWNVEESYGIGQSEDATIPVVAPPQQQACPGAFSEVGQPEPVALVCAMVVDNPELADAVTLDQEAIGRAYCVRRLLQVLGIVLFIGMFVT